MFLRKGCILYTCNNFLEKLPECNHSASCQWQLSYDVTLTLTILGIHISHLAYIIAILIAPRQPRFRFCSPDGGLYAGPPTVTSMLRNIHTDDTLTAFTWTTQANNTDTGMRGGVCSSKQCKSLARQIGF